MTHIQKYEQKHYSTSTSSKHNSLSKLRRRPKGYCLVKDEFVALKLICSEGIRSILIEAVH